MDGSGHVVNRSPHGVLLISHRMLLCRGDTKDTWMGVEACFQIKSEKKTNHLVSPTADVRMFMDLCVAVHVCVGDLVIHYGFYQLSNLAEKNFTLNQQGTWLVSEVC